MTDDYITDRGSIEGIWCWTTLSFDLRQTRGSTFFETALSDTDRTSLSSLLDTPSYLRDNGALTWDYRVSWSINGR